MNRLVLFLGMLLLLSLLMVAVSTGILVDARAQKVQSAAMRSEQLENCPFSKDYNFQTYDLISILLLVHIRV